MRKYKFEQREARRTSGTHAQQEEAEASHKAKERGKETTSEEVATVEATTETQIGAAMELSMDACTKRLGRRTGQGTDCAGKGMHRKPIATTVKNVVTSAVGGGAEAGPSNRNGGRPSNIEEAESQEGRGDLTSIMQWSPGKRAW